MKKQAKKYNRNREKLYHVEVRFNQTDEDGEPTGNIVHELDVIKARNLREAKDQFFKKMGLITEWHGYYE